MAVDPNHRRQGYGLLLLEAVEEIARLGGQRDLYLHLRYAARCWKHRAACLHESVQHLALLKASGRCGCHYERTVLSASGVIMASHACRMQDAPAEALYRRGGYREANRDNPLVFLLGQDRRYLMHKRLAPILTPGSA